MTQEHISSSESENVSNLPLADLDIDQINSLLNILMDNPDFKDIKDDYSVITSEIAQAPQHSVIDIEDQPEILDTPTVNLESIEGIVLPPKNPLRMRKVAAFTLLPLAALSVVSAFGNRSDSRPADSVAAVNAQADTFNQLNLLPNSLIVVPVEASPEPLPTTPTPNPSEAIVVALENTIAAPIEQPLDAAAKPARSSETTVTVVPEKSKPSIPPATPSPVAAPSPTPAPSTPQRDPCDSRTIGTSEQRCNKEATSSPTPSPQPSDNPDSYKQPVYHETFKSPQPSPSSEPTQNSGIFK